jgi:hypothetical protein
LEQYQVDGLVIDKVEEIVWKRWLDKASPENYPKIIMVFSDGDQLIKEDGIVGKGGFRTDMKRHGYDTRYWMMRAWEYCAALDQVRLVTVFWKKTVGGKITQPTKIALPARAMSNLLMPVGVPKQAWTDQAMGPAVTKKGIPCIVGKIGIQDVYDWAKVSCRMRYLVGFKPRKGFVGYNIKNWQKLRDIWRSQKCLTSKEA